VLLKIKKNLDHRYYNTGQETISDLKYDLLVEFLGVNNSIGCKIRDSDNTVLLPFHLGSMDKIKKDEIQKLENWKKNNNHKNYVISDKLNGVSCLLVYSLNEDKPKIYTRGDGTEGADISYLSDKIVGIPSYKKNLVVRGELIIEKDIFNEKYSQTYKNSLSLIVGNVNSKTLREAFFNKDIRFVAYELMDSNKITPEKHLEYLKKLNFEVVKYSLLKYEDLTDENLSKILQTRKDDSENPYDIDGVIVHSNMPYENPKEGNPKYAFAYKMLLDTAEAVVEDVEWNSSKWGVLKPRIKITPTQLSRITINYTTGFNAAFIRDNKINIGSRVLITRSGEIIPYLVVVLSQS
jgi:DNA ligase (NAD+)